MEQDFLDKNLEYHPVAKFLHWVVVIIVAVQFIVAGIMPEVRRSVAPESLVSFHMSLGMLVIPFVLALLCMRFLWPVRKPEMLTPTWKGRSAVAMHYLLYILLILLPISGWAYASGRGWTVNVFGWFGLPMIFGAGSQTAHAIGEMHGILTTFVGVLLIGHLGAALHHHFILKDEILWRMLPWKRKSNKGGEQ